MVDHIEKYFRKLTYKQRAVILSKIEILREKGLDPSLDIKPIKGKKGFFRLRIGKLIRIIFHFDSHGDIIIDGADNRDNVYKNL